jgi:hypothetical protein
MAGFGTEGKIATAAAETVDNLLLAMELQPAIEKGAEELQVMQPMHSGDTREEAVRKLHPEFTAEDVVKNGWAVLNLNVPPHWV